MLEGIETGIDTEVGIGRVKEVGVELEGGVDRRLEEQIEDV